MPKSSAARKPTLVHPASTSRIERASTELLELRRQIKELENQKDELSARLLVMVKREGEEREDSKGVVRVRYETDQHRFIVIPGKNVTINEGVLRKTMLSLGVEPKRIEKYIAPAKKTVKYEYVGVYERKADGEGEENGAA